MFILYILDINYTECVSYHLSQIQTNLQGARRFGRFSFPYKFVCNQHFTAAAKQKCAVSSTTTAAHTIFMSVFKLNIVIDKLSDQISVRDFGFVHEAIVPARQQQMPQGCGST